MDNYKNFIQFKVNGVTQIVKNEFQPETTLNEYIRDHLNLKGTKITCHEGGCGVCIVNGTYFDHVKNEEKNVAINSCIFPLYSCNNWEFTTIEGLGCRSKKIHPIQKRLADKNGSQCGYCSPGFVMSMYSLLKNNQKPDKKTIESTFDGNICRCTGYRAILDAMKSFAENESPIDIEDLHQMKCLDDNQCKNKDGVLMNHLKSKWYAPNDLNEFINIFQKHQNDKYKLVGGNTGKGLFKAEVPDLIYINLQNIKELYEIKQTDLTISIGANLTLTLLIELLNKTSNETTGFEYLSELSNIIKKVANTTVRNIGTWSGNLILKHDHQYFPSDLFIAFKTVDAVLNVRSAENKIFKVKLDEFLKLDMKGKFIHSIEFKKFNKSEYLIKVFKVMPRSQMAHSYVYAGFLFPVQNDIINQEPRIVIGGVVNPYFESKSTIAFLNGKNFKSNEIFKESCRLLDLELGNVEINYYKSLAISLYYKFALSVHNISYSDSRLLSALESINDNREVSKGTQNIQSNPELYPLTQPIPKSNSYAQTCGESVYNSDIPSVVGQLHGAFIQSKVGNCRIDKIDYESALKASGVVKIIFAKDVPDNNIFPYPGAKEELFAEDYIAYAGQPLGLVIAESDKQARYATSLVNVTYKDHKKPLLTINDAIEANSYHPIAYSDFVHGNAEESIKKSLFKINGEFSNEGQFHFFLENHIAISTPTEDGFEIDCGSQWLDYIQKAVGQSLKVKNLSDVDVKTKQIGGGFGGKITRSATVACAAAVASSITKRTVRVAPDLNSTMRTGAKRFPQLYKYTAGFDENGKINGVKVLWYSDPGYLSFDNMNEFGYSYFDNAYFLQNLHIVSYIVKTNTPMNTSFRAPFSFPAITLIENVIDHIAIELNLDPIAVRKLNMYKKDDTTHIGLKMPYYNLDKIYDTLIDTSEYQQRKENVDDYNSKNKWKKRGISLIPMKYGAILKEGYYSTMVNIFNGDGSVAVSHGGIEIGQGINTKVAQVCAYELGVPFESVVVKQANNSVTANSQWTGASVTTEIVAKGVIECCKIINSNLEPVRKLMSNENYTWRELISKAFSMNVDLSARYYVANDKNDTDIIKYNVYAAACSEVLIDVLTGEQQILRSDILYDCGRPLNGLIDIGQAEGAFAQGIGFTFLEKYIYDKKTGHAISDGTWDYFTPLSKDIPVDFRISFLENSKNPIGVLGAKCIGEPPLVLSLSAFFACKRAIEAARLEFGNNKFFNLDTPLTPEKIQTFCLTNFKNFNF